MKKDSIAKLQVTKSQIRRMAGKQRLTVGLDLGDRSSRYCILNEAGEKASENQLPTTKAGLDSVFAKRAPCRIALEVGTHSPWVSRHLAAMGHEVIVANPRKVRLITESVQTLSESLLGKPGCRLSGSNPSRAEALRAAARGTIPQTRLDEIRTRPTDDARGRGGCPCSPDRMVQGLPLSG